MPTKIVNIEEFKSLVGITGTTKDTRLQLIAEAAEAFVEGLTGQDLGGNVWDELYTGDGTDELILTHYPVTGLTLVEIVNTPDPNEVLVLTGPDRDVTFQRGGILKRTGRARWPARPPEAIHVQYTSARPGRDLVMAIYDLMEHRWKTAKNTGFKSETIGNYSYTMADIDQIPGFKMVLNRYIDPARKIK